MDKKQYLVGSQLLNLKNWIDTDYFIFDENENRFILKINNKEQHIETFYASSSILTKYFNFEEDYVNFPHAERVYSVLYQYDIDIIQQNFPIVFHVLEHKTDYIKFLQYLVNNNRVIFNVVCKDRKTNFIHCDKNTYHIAYITYILKNNSTTLTAEQQQIIQTIHDKQMPISYLDELKAEIMAL